MSKHIKKMKKRKELLSLLDFIFVLGKEDSIESFAYAINQNGGMMAIADSTSPQTDEEISPAYRASRITTGTLDAQFFTVSNERKKIDEIFLPTFAEKFSLELRKNLSDTFEHIPPISCGSFFMQCEGKKFYTGYLGCGSVRLFLLTGQGLMILSPEEFPAVISGKMFDCPLPAILLCASDRTFRKFESPMDFEYVLLDTLCDSQTIEGWKTLLTKRILSEEDRSFQLLVGSFGFGSFKTMQKTFSNRKSNLYWNFLSKETNATPYEAEAMNTAYEQNYLSYRTGNAVLSEEDKEGDNEI